LKGENPIATGHSLFTQNLKRKEGNKKQRERFVTLQHSIKLSFPSVPKKHYVPPQQTHTPMKNLNRDLMYNYINRSAHLSQIPCIREFNLF
uniref:Uncharacterized protein n=1 Tax=Chrysemys picta bellii TaxID=8478 RepID=A0A8C3F2J6_CHRPI